MDQSSNKAPIFTKSFTINFIVNFIVYLCMYLLLVVIAGYSKQTFHASDSLAGLVVGLFIVGSLIGRFGTGKFVNQIGPKRLLSIGLVALILTQLLYFVDGSLAFLIFVRLINGIATAIVTTATGTIAAYVTPVNRKSEGISLFSLSLVLGTAIGPFLGMLLITKYSINLLFIICAALGVLGLIISLFIKVDFDMSESKTNHNMIEKRTFSIHQFIAKEAIPVAIVMLLIGVTYASILTYLQAFAIERQLVTAASYFFICYAIASLVTRPIAGRLMDDKNENVIVYPAFIMLFLSFVCLIISHQSWLILIAGACLGLGYGNLSSAMQSIAIKVSPPIKYGIATSTFYVGLDAGVGFGPSFLGLFSHMFSHSQIFGFMAVLAIITMVVYFFVHGRHVTHNPSH
ncbi:MFS transporter [Staphylococcus argenteus]|uniref:MFS transporter n=1 Tax=Staphylococcus argenteus TaxID=985002 RepID=UPI00031C9F64|nr:major facilitator superfamily protein (MFS) [Staphylococcus argenteus]CDR63958.1 major facilitator superfamily protein (MFS) [Staphylococcus argenteus]SGW92631.1 major facilitator superfamily protein (MFS) [Staphylococcus argenteus]SGX37636.1 major facilitator superfamily protein (MFS) [Staphylococcus argenteus]SGX38103.1 major facilitator superfamily protein (MFS) [Staphylococcus argenteus]